ncbi:hypothetical protein ACP4OV_005875 [Aristida adscensionis]
MEGTVAAAAGREDRRVAAPRLGGAEGADQGGGVPAAVAPERGDGLGDWEEARLLAEEEAEEGGDLAVGLVDSLEAVSACLARRCQIGEGSSQEERAMDVEGQKEGSLAFAPQKSTEPGSFPTCRVANGGLLYEALCAPRCEAVSSKDVGCVDDMLDKATECLPGSRGDCSGQEAVKTSKQDVQMACGDAHHDYGGLSNSMKHNSEQQPCGFDGLRSIPNIETGVCRPLQEDSGPSVPRGTYVYLDGKEVRCDQTPCDSVTCHVSDRGVANKGIHAPVGEGSQSIDAGHMCDTEDKVTEASPFHEGLSDSGCHRTDKLLCGADSQALTIDHELENDGFLPKICASVSRPLNEAPFPSIYGSSIDAPLDGKAGWADEMFQGSSSITCVEKVACASQEGDMLFCENGHRMAAYEDENQHSRMDMGSRFNLSLCEEARSEALQSLGPCAQKEVQQISRNYETSELPTEGDMCCSLFRQSCHDKPCCSGRESSTPYWGHQASALGSSDPLGHLEQDLDACNSAEGKPCSVDFVSIANDGESQNQKLIVFRRRNPKRAASSRSLNSEKPDHQIKKASGGRGKAKKVDIVSSLHQSSMSMFPNKITKGRSGLIRPHKSSAWGSLQKLLGGFCQTSNSHPSYLETGISNKRSDQKNKTGLRKSRSSRSSKSKCSTLSGMGHLVDELSGQPTVSAIADTDASLEGHGEDIPKLASHALPCADSANMQQLKRGLVSSTQETCHAYIHGEHAKLSTSETSLNNANGTVMLHVGFSPDSVLEVASVTCESNASANHDVILHENSSDAGALNGVGHHLSVLSTSDSGKDPAPLSMHLEQQDKTDGGSESTRKEQTGPSHTMKDNDSAGVQTLQKSCTVTKDSIVRKRVCKKKDGNKGKNLNTRNLTQKSSFEASELRALTNGSISSDPPDSLLHIGHPELGSCFEVQTSATQDLVAHEHVNMQSHSLTDSDKGSAFHNMKSPRRKKKDANTGRMGKVRDSHAKGKNKKKTAADGTSLDHGLFKFPSTELAACHMDEQSDLKPATEPFKNSVAIPADLPGIVACKVDEASGPPPPPRAAWVCCDDCQKWRCIPTELADIIGETNCKWTCKDNGDKAFADCSIPQEKTNAEINAELELSDASADEADNAGSNSKACRAPSWTHVRINLFLHRNRRTQSIDESMVCNCKPPQDGRMGCRDGCLNRMLNIECVKRTCPCGEQCSNQQFQRRTYAKLKWFHSGQKGYGLQLQEDVSAGRFLIEYVGEVLDITSYESRQRYYASKGQKHFYFMALNGGEVIDACTKGNLGRFINHSCSPNCRTEKWMVNGEVCIGIFAMRSIKKGEELTFDYNYVRVSGAAPQKCFCGTTKCRGYIGGDISVVDTITQDDAEAGHFEEVVADKDSKGLMGADGSGSHGNHPDIAEPDFSVQGEDLYDCPAANAELEPLQQHVGILFDTDEPSDSLEAWSPQEDGDVVRTPVHVSRTIERPLQHFPVHGTQPSDHLQRAPNGPQAPDGINGSTSSDYVGNLVPGFNANKRNNLKQHRNLKPSSSSSSSSSPIDNEHILGVEGRLNNLLDRDGGISKRKDATNGYLKLLFVTAAEGDSAGVASQSMRDLSMILDALLKTKSHAVLLDIINKNGLQMLHNILKQNRSKFQRIPIIRKLLKVLEFLALKNILTSEHINEGPRYVGAESFRDAILNLTRHNDIQVHQIARKFRDRWIQGGWIPRNIARSGPAEYPRASTSAQDIRGTNMVWNSARRKRKSRWDYQPDEHYKMVGLKIQKAFSEHGELQGTKGTNSYHDNVPGMGSSSESVDDEAPPGFESQQDCQPAQAFFGCAVAPGLCMERYQPSLAISYGIPAALAQHTGTPEEGQGHQKWKVAPGVPFIPFPPLPPYPRGSPCPSTSSQMSHHDGTPAVNHNSSGHCGRTVDRDGRVHRTWRNGLRSRWPYNNQGRKIPNNNHRFER